MAVLMTEDKKELIVTCKCGCESAFHIMVDDQDKDHYCFLCFMKGDFQTEQNVSIWRTLMKKCKKLWYVLRNKDYCYSDTIMSREQFEVFREYINQF